MSPNLRFAPLGAIALFVFVSQPSEAADAENPWTTNVAPARGSEPTAGTGGAYANVKQLTLREAVRRTLASSPALRAAQSEIEAKDGEAFQATRLPNPELLVEIENFGGSKDKKSFDTAEETVSLVQLIELGGKRTLRLEQAQLDRSLSSWDFEAVRVQYATAVAQAFVDVLTAQERAKVLADFVTIAEKTKKSVDARVTGGKASPIELDRALVALARARSLAKAETARLNAAKRRIATYWGSHSIGFEVAAGRLGNGTSVPSIDHLRAYLDNNPSVARWSDEISRRAVQVDLEHAKAIPDVRIGAGVRQFNENDATAAVASVSIPLPIFDRNTGNISAAESRLQKVEADAAASREEAMRALIEAVGELEVAATQLKALKADVLPVAQTAFERTKLGYDEGKFDILNVLDAQRSVFDVRLDLLSARADYEKARVRVEALVGRDLSDF